MVITANGIANGHKRMKTEMTGASPKMDAILQVIGWQGCAALVASFFDVGHPCYGQ